MQVDDATLKHWRNVIRDYITDIASVPHPEPVQLTDRVVLDEASDTYLLIVNGWKDGYKRQHGIILHVEINDGKIWIQADGTEDGIAQALVDAGVPTDRIVLAFKSPRMREYSEFAVA